MSHCGKLQPRDTHFVCGQLEATKEPGAMEHEGDGEDLIALVCVGENFAVPAQENNNEGVEFYILQCQQATHIVAQRFTCPWGGEFDVGDHVIVGIYYQKWGCGDNGYVFLGNSQLAFVYTHLVIAWKFAMLLAHHRVKGDELVYQIANEALQVIKSRLDVAS